MGKASRIATAEKKISLVDHRKLTDEKRSRGMAIKGRVQINGGRGKPNPVLIQVQVVISMDFFCIDCEEEERSQ